MSKLPKRPDQAYCDRFNKRHAIGVAGIVKKDRGEKVETRTLSEAFMMGGHTAVIMLEGISGAYLLERFEVKS